MNAEYGSGVDAGGDTGPAFRPLGHPDTSVDLDLLADYSCGVLDPAQTAEVAARIATDPGWAAAYRQLVEADAAVRGDLAGFTAEPPTMPGDIAARLDAALAAAAHPSAPPSPPVGTTLAAPVSLASRRRKRMRVAAVAAVAATVVAVAGVAVGVIVNPPATDRSTATSEPGVAREDGGAAEEPRPAPSRKLPSAQSDQNEVVPPAKANPQVRHSGRNYTAATLRQVTASPSPHRSGLTPRAAPARPMPKELRRLDEQNERLRCLKAVRDRYGAYPTLVDYARYEGDAALIMVLPAERGGSRPRILVVGPDCGNSGTDQRYLQK